ncbi:helix-turn-helix domain-containing protein [Salmonella enterica]|nr:helix-turn-helix domain-containing protein [Salmonella enterica]
MYSTDNNRTKHEMKFNGVGVPLEVQIIVKTKLEGPCQTLCQSGESVSSVAAYGDGKTIAFRIRLARENLGMSEDDLAEKLDIHPGDVLAWENSSDQPLAGMIIPLANALRCDPMWLLTGEAVNSQGLSGEQQSPASQRVDALSREVPQR